MELGGAGLKRRLEVEGERADRKIAKKKAQTIDPDKNTVESTTYIQNTPKFKKRKEKKMIFLVRKLFIHL